jgi:hypothetical protein
MKTELPRVSTILKVLDSDAYAGVSQQTLDTAAERGEALHRLCLSYLASLDGVHEVPVPTIPYVAAYQAFVTWCTENAILVVAIEERSENTQFGYCGTPDALVILKGEEVLIDLKFTASTLRINKVQLRAYWKLDHYKTAKRAMLIHIGPLTGKLKVHPIAKHSNDWQGFLNALSVWKWRQS